MNLEKFFNPKSVVVIGASSDLKKVGGALISNLRAGNSREIYEVNLEHKEIPNNADLAIIAIKAEAVPQALEDCGKAGISNVIVISSGFREMAVGGEELENKISEIAENYNIALLGPNCLGVINTKTGLNATFSAQNPISGKIAFLSQSGALGTALIDWANNQGVGISKFVSLGNEARLTEIEFLEYLENDPETSMILLYTENVKDGRKFLEVLSRVASKKTVVVIKAGTGTHGNLAVKSHTGTFASEASVFMQACKQAGAVTVSSLRAFFHLIKILPQIEGVKTPIQRLVVLTNGGGPSIVAADLIDRSKSLSLAKMDENIKEALREVLPPMSAIGNPIDLLGDALADRYDRALEIIINNGNTDGILAIMTPQMMTEARETAKILMKWNSHKKIFPVLTGGSSVQAGREELIKSGMPYFTFPRDVIESLDYLAKGAPKLRLPHGTGKSSGDGEMMNFWTTLEVLSQYNLTVNGRFLSRKEDLENALHECGEGPYAMKAVAPSIIHKTEVGAVRLNVKNLDEAYVVWEELWQKFIHLDGILVQKMEKNEREVIIGMKRDLAFGPTIIFGLGGIFTEAIKDTVMRIAPVSKEEALAMIKEIKGIKILEGLRGKPPVNFDALADIIVNLSRLSLEHSEIKEIDLNPVICSEASATIVDARAIV